MGCDWMRATCDPTPTGQPSNRLTDYTWALGLLYVLTTNCLVFVQTIVGAPCWLNNRKAHKKTTNKITSSSHGPKIKPASCSFPPLSLTITTTTTTTIVRPRLRRRRWTKDGGGSVRCLTLRGSEIQLQSPRCSRCCCCCCCYYHASSAMQHNNNTPQHRNNSNFLCDDSRQSAFVAQTGSSARFFKNIDFKLSQPVKAPQEERS